MTNKEKEGKKKAKMLQKAESHMGEFISGTAVKQAGIHRSS